jgi:acetone carboxylase gamma subunit
MNFKQIIAVFAALVVLGAYYYFFEVKKRAEDEKSKTAAVKFLPGFSAAKAAGITIENGASEIVLKKQGEEWQMEKPIKTGAAKRLVENILSGFESENYSMKLDKMNPADIGLSGSRQKAVFTFQDGTNSEVVFGMDNPAGSSVYAEKSGDTLNAYLVSGSLKAMLGKSVFDLRYKSALKINTPDVAKVVVDLKDRKYTIEKKSGTWQFTPATEDKLKNDRIESFISGMPLTEARSMEPGTAAALKKHSLDSPSEYVAFTAGKDTATIYFGAKDEKKSSRFAKNSQQGDILELPDYIYTNVPKADELIDKRICTLDQSKAQRIEMSLYGKSFSAEKKVDGSKRESWDIKKTNIDKKTMDKVLPSSIISSISWLEYKAKVAPKAGANLANEYGLTPGDNEISVFDPKGARVAGLLFGKKINDNVYVKVYQTDKIYEVDSAFIRNLNIPGLEAK